MNRRGLVGIGTIRNVETGEKIKQALTEGLSFRHIRGPDPTYFMFDDFRIPRGVSGLHVFEFQLFVLNDAEQLGQQVGHTLLSANFEICNNTFRQEPHPGEFWLRVLTGYLYCTMTDDAGWPSRATCGTNGFAAVRPQRDDSNLRKVTGP